jgi:hypothetical protein
MVQWAGINPGEDERGCRKSSKPAKLKRAESRTKFANGLFPVSTKGGIARRGVLPDWLPGAKRAMCVSTRKERETCNVH